MEKGNRSVNFPTHKCTSSSSSSSTVLHPVRAPSSLPYLFAFFSSCCLFSPSAPRPVFLAALRKIRSAVNSIQSTPTVTKKTRPTQSHGTRRQGGNRGTEEKGIKEVYCGCLRSLCMSPISIGEAWKCREKIDSEAEEIFRKNSSTSSSLVS
jgi:hypothetical protein